MMCFKCGCETLLSPWPEIEKGNIGAIKWICERCKEEERKKISGVSELEPSHIGQSGIL